MIELEKRVNIADLALKLHDEWIDRFPESESLTLTFERINNNAVCKYDALEITVDGGFHWKKKVPRKEKQND